MEADDPLTIVSYAGPNEGTCGYCSSVLLLAVQLVILRAVRSPPGQRSRERTSHTLGLWPSQLSCVVREAITM